MNRSWVHILRRCYGVGSRSAPNDVPWFQRPNVRRTIFWCSLTIGVGYIISRVGVISDTEEKEVLQQYKVGSFRI
jgi:hypothetical protein